MNGKKTIHIKRDDLNGKDIEWVRAEDHQEVVQTVSQTEDINSKMSQYTQDTFTQNKLNNIRAVRRSRGMKSRILRDKGSMFLEEGFVDQGNSTIRDRSMGAELYPNDKTSVNFAYQRNQEQTTFVDKDFHVGHFRFKYLDFGKLKVENAWELKMNDGPDDNLQLFSDGFIQANLTPEWTALARYEWSWNKNLNQNIDVARFTEVQLGVAYRPIWNDRLTFLADYKYLTDDFPSDQISTLEGFIGHDRSIYQAEMMLDINEHLTWVEKIALRQQEVRVLGSDNELSRTILHAHRLNLKLNQKVGLAFEYRVLSQTLSDDISQGVLIEADIRLLDTLSMAVGYNFSDFNSDVSSDLNIEKEGVYMRVFYDPIKEVLKHTSILEV